MPGANSNRKVTPYQLFMFLLCIFVLGAMAFEVTLPIDSDTKKILNTVDTAICVIFFVDFLWRLATAKDRLGYLRWGWLDLVSSIPAVSWFRLGRIFRVLRVIRVLRGLHSIKDLMAVGIKNRSESTFLSVVLVTIITITFGSIIILHFEQNFEGSNITTVEESLWWCFVTVTTVGYGDYFPVSTEGRMVACVLMTIGVGLFGTFTGFVATWFLEGREGQDKRVQKLRHQLTVAEAANHELLRRIEKLEVQNPTQEETD